MKFTTNTLDNSGAKFVLRKALTFAEQELPYRRQKTPRMRREAAFGVFCLTTVYPIYTTGAHGNSGGKSAGKDVFPSGKGQKCPEISGNRYSQILWDSVKKWRIMTSSSLGESPYFMRSSGICIPFEPFPRCLTTVIPLYFHFKNWLNFVQQQN